MYICVCMYVYACVNWCDVYVYMCVYVCICMRELVCKRMYVCMYTCMHTCSCLHTHTAWLLELIASNLLYVCVCVYIYIYIYICILALACKRIQRDYRRVCMYVCMYVQLLVLVASTLLKGKTHFWVMKCLVCMYTYAHIHTYRTDSCLWHLLLWKGKRLSVVKCLVYAHIHIQKHMFIHTGRACVCGFYAFEGQDVPQWWIARDSGAAYVICAQHSCVSKCWADGSWS
jgi:hypothetical protein